MKIQKQSLNEQYLIEKLVGPICSAIAYAFCTGVSKQEALRLFPGQTRLDKLDEVLLKNGFERVSGEHYTQNDWKLSNYAKLHNKGRYFLACDGNPGHAVALIDGVLYNTNGYENSRVLRAYKLDKNVTGSKETAYFDSIEQKDLKYAEYCQDYILYKYKINPPDITEISRDSFVVKFENRSFEIEFPFFCTDDDVKKIIQKEVDKNIRFVR